MIDRQLENKLRLLTVQLDSWKKLHDLITYGLDKAKPIISAEQERQFTEIRSHLLQETEYIYRELGLLGEARPDEGCEQQCEDNPLGNHFTFRWLSTRGKTWAPCPEADKCHTKRHT